jgi:myosin-crossreactive antigen
LGAEEVRFGRCDYLADLESNCKTRVMRWLWVPEKADVVFTLEYSIRSAQTASYNLLGLSRTPPSVYKGQYDPRVLLKAFLTLHDKSV